MKKSSLTLATLLCLSSLEARAAFRLDYSEKKDAAVNLIDNCSKAVLTTISCDLPETIYKTSFTIPKEYVGAAGNQITIDGTFKNVGGKLLIRIAGVDYPLDDKGSFPLPSGASGTIDVSIVAKTAGKTRLAIVHAAKISSITLELNGRDHIDRTNNGLAALLKDAQDQKKAYRKYKSFLSWFKLSPATLGPLKEEITGRDATDMSDDCQVNGRGETDVLGDEACQRLILLNGILQGKSKVEIAESDKADAFEDAKTAVTAYQTAFTQVLDAGIELASTYQTQLDELLAWVNDETRVTEEEKNAKPEVTPS